MSEQENSGQTKEAPLLVVEQEQSTTGGRQTPYRPTDLTDDQPEVHQRLSRASPAVPSVVEELKAEEHTTPPRPQEEKSDRKIHEHASSEKHKHHDSKKSSKKRIPATPPPPENIETIALTTIEIEPAFEKENLSLPAQPIPADVKSVSGVSEGPAKHADEDDIILEEIAELRTREATARMSEWSDVEEAGGLPRSESRASRVSRAVRQLFCCGTAYSPPSEDDISCAREQSGI